MQPLSSSLSLSLTLTWEALLSGHKAPDWIPMWKRELKHRLFFLYPACELLIGSPEALAVSRPDGSITILWLGILTRGDPVEVDSHRRAWVAQHWPLFSPLSPLCKRARPHRDKFGGAAERSRAPGPQVALQKTFVSFTNAHFAPTTGSLRGRTGADILITCQWIVDAPGAWRECIYTGQNAKVLQQLFCHQTQGKTEKRQKNTALR